MPGIPSVLDLGSFVNGPRGFKIYGTWYTERAGASVASAGDVNGDGFADIIVGAPGVPVGLGYYYWGGPQADYAAYVVFGRGAEPSPNTGHVFRIILSGDAEGGFAVSSAGDFNGDGFGDVMVSAPSYGLDHKGATYIVFGKAGGFTDVTLGSTTSSDWIRIDGAAAYDRSGQSVASLG